MKTWKKFSILAALVLLMFAWRPAWAVLVNALEDFVQISAPSNPAAGNSRLYVDSGTKKLACLNSDGSSCAPSGGSGATDPFTSPGTFTNLGTGCTVTTGVSAPFGGTGIMVLGSTGTSNVCGQSVTASGNFTHVFAFYPVVPNNNFASFYVGFTDGTKVEYCGYGYNSGNFLTAASSTALNNGSYAGVPNTNTTQTPLGYPEWFRLTSSGAGTLLKCEYSPDNATWSTVFNDNSGAPFLTPSAVFFATDPRGSAIAPLGTLVSYN